MSGEAYRAYAIGIAHTLQSGQVSLPYLLLQHYKRLNLSDTEAMLIIHMTGFRQNEMNDFPTIDEMAQRMSAGGSAVVESLQRLMKEGFLTIDEDVDPATNVHYEHYNWNGLWDKLGKLLMEDMREERKRKRAKAPSSDQTEMSLFEIFEKEFGRPLSPFEYETIASWIDEDRYPHELILLALKEAVFAGKIHFKYIDRILLEWNRSNIKTVEEARVYSQKFRGGK
ncbi:DnaD domain protein [Paenibacillus marinisediminis]